MSFFVEYRKRLQRLLNLPESASWEDCLAAVEALVRPNCDHDWLERGTPDDRWWECFLCGTIED